MAEWRWEQLFDAWWSVTHAMQRLGDNPESADDERHTARTFADPGLKPKLSFDPAEDIAAPFIAKGVRPKVAILREQGVNDQIEMANAFERAGFDAFDVHMSDLVAGRVKLASFTCLTTTDGRATILRPHPERTPRSINLRWSPDGWPDDSPWPRMFRNARIWCR